MSTSEEYGRCRACGAVCDGDVCDSACEQMAQAELDDKIRAEHNEDDRASVHDSMTTTKPGRFTPRKQRPILSRGA